MKVPRLSERLAVTALEAKRVPRATPQLLKGRSPGSCQNGGQKVELPQEHGLGEGMGVVIGSRAIDELLEFRDLGYYSTY